MLRVDSVALLRFVLLTSAAGAGCGGSVDRGTATGGGATSGGASGSSGSTSSSSSGGSTSSSGSASSSGSTGVINTGGGGDCRSGTIIMSEEFCCTPGTSCARALDANPDAGLRCAVDCDRVCAAALPGVTQSFPSCSWQSDGELSYLCGSCGVGRVPSATEPFASGRTIGERLARQAYYEAASVTAFVRLLGALELAGAPWALLQRAHAAANDEVRHASLFAELAATHGVVPRAPRYAASAAPSLFELALENATEGCVRETFGAVVTLHQATHAEDEEIRTAFAAIAEDEAEHAALSWELKAWFDAQLTAQERDEVNRAHERAVRAARQDVAVSPDALGLALGLPSTVRARRMFDTLMATMAAAA